MLIFTRILIFNISLQPLFVEKSTKNNTDDLCSVMCITQTNNDGQADAKRLVKNGKGKVQPSATRLCVHQLCQSMNMK